jgi:hypothetical protein
MHDVPVLVWILVLSYAVAIVTLPALAVARGGAPRQGLVIGLSLGVVMIVSATLASQDVYRHTSDQDFVWVGIPMFSLFALLLAGSCAPSVRRALAHPSIPVWLAVPQAFRLAGIVFVWLIFTDDLAGTFGWPAGIGDIIVGIWALMLIAQARKGAVDRASAIRFNLFGLLDLVVAVFFGGTSNQGFLQLFDVTPSTEAMTVLPLALIPTVGVPIMAVMHIVALRQLRATSHATRR